MGAAIVWLPPLSLIVAEPTIGFASVRRAAVGGVDRVAVRSGGAEAKAAEAAAGVERHGGRAAGQDRAEDGRVLSAPRHAAAPVARRAPRPAADWSSTVR